MGAAPRMARRIPHNRLFGAGIVAAGLALVLVALAPHLFLAIAAVMLVGGFAGIAFLTGLTIIGTQVADEIRGRVNAFVQTIVRLTLLGSLAVVPRDRRAWWPPARSAPITIDGTRVVMFAGGLVAAAVGSIAYRQMDDRRTAPMLPDLLAALRRGEPREGTGSAGGGRGHRRRGGRRAGRSAGRPAARRRVHRRRARGRRRGSRALGGSAAGGVAVRAPRAGAGGRGDPGRPGRTGGPARAGRRRAGRRRPVPGRAPGPVRGRDRRGGSRRAGGPRGVGHRAVAAGRVGAARPRPRW